MGAAVSTSVAQDNIKVINKVIADFVSINQTSSSLSSVNSQTLNVENVKAYGCTLNIEQTQDIKVKIIQQFTTTSASQLAAALTSNINASIDAAASSKTGAIPLAVSAATTITNSKKDIETVIKNTTKVENLNSLVVSVNNTQNSNIKGIVIDTCGMSLYPGGPPETVVSTCVKNVSTPCKFSQNMLVDVFSQQLTNSIVSQLSNVSSVQTLVSNVSAKSNAFAGGLLDIFSNPWAVTASIGCFSMVCIIFIALAVFGTSDNAMAMVNPEAAAAKAAKNNTLKELAAALAKK